MHPKRRAPDSTPLLRMSPSEATPLWLELAKRQAGRRRPADLRRQLERDGFVAPSALDQRMVHRLDGIALEAASEFEALQLSPVAPLGACSVLAPTDQDRTLSALRGTEVVSDPTNVLALQCARRLEADPKATVRLCTAHQVLRTQPLPPGRGFSPHFRMFALAEAGRAEAEDRFEVRAIARHLRVFDGIFDACERVLDLAFPNRRAIVFAAPDEEVVATRVTHALEEAVPHAAIDREPLESRYYAGVRVLFGAEDSAGDFVPIADTGRFDWVARLTSNERLRFVASGIGIQLAPVRFRR